jgi:putative N6-adenine-specific DNA methylase
MQEVQDHNIRLITPPGLEEAASWELIHKFAFNGKIHQDRGGLQVQSTFADACAWVQAMRSITRVLWRVHHFRARDFPKLYEQIKKFHWSQWIVSPTIGIKVSAKQSRLMHTDRIEKAVQDGINEHFRAYPCKKKWLELASNYPQTTLYVRMENDVCTLSLDLAGDALYKRGEDKHGHLASLRENLAFCLLSHFVRKIDVHSATKELEWIVDPMCGSGTLLQEIYNFDQAASERQFAFQSLLPCLQEKTPLQSPVPSWPLKKRPALFGFDRSPEIVVMARKNCPYASISAADIFVTKEGRLNVEGKGAAIVNPPYGERLILDKPQKIYYKELLNAIADKYAVDYIGIITPSDIDLSSSYSKKDSKLKMLQKVSFENGGIKVTFWIIAIKR